MENKRIGIYGISNVSNFGCEAIVRSTVNLLYQVNPNYHIIYYSRNAKNDAHYIGDLGINIVQISRKPDVVSRVVNKVLAFLGIHFRIPYDDYKKICRETDVIFSIGGDIYTIRDYDRENKRHICSNRMVQFGEYAKKRGKKLIIYGASIGPFGNNKSNQDYFFNHLKKADLIVCREKLTVDYLKNNDITENVIFSPDPAYFITDGKITMPSECKNERIAINLSPTLLIKGQESIENQKSKIAMLIQDLVNQLDTTALLLPHVYSDDIGDDDYEFMKDIYRRIENTNKSRFVLVSNCKGFMQTKKLIRTCKMVIAARMHCAINAMSEGVPTILLSYSEKSIGMTQYIYGTGNWVIKNINIYARLIDSALDMFKNAEAISEYLDNRMKEIRNEKDRCSLVERISLVIKF